MAYVTQQIIKTTEGWATFDALGKPVPKDYWLFERVTETVGDVTKKYYKFKISDGVSLFADLPYQLLNGHSASINKAGNWLVYDDATQTYKDSGVKAVGVDGKSAFELWQTLEDNADKTIVDFFIFLKGEKGDAFTFDDFTIEQLALLKGASAYQVWKAQDGNEDKTVEEYLQYIKGAPFTYEDFTEEQLADLKGQDGQSAYLDAKAKGYTGTKDEFDTLLARISSGGGYLDISFLFDTEGEPVTSITQEQLDLIVKAYNDKVSTVLWDETARPAAIYTTGSGYNISVNDIGYDKGVTRILTFTFEITSINLSVYIQYGGSALELGGNGAKALMDNGQYKDVLSPTDVATLTSLSSLSSTKYSQKYTYTSTTAQGINFTSTPAEGFECMLDIKNDTSSQITQAIPNAAAWQCDETSLLIPAGKVGSISIRYVHGQYCVRVGL